MKNKREESKKSQGNVIAVILIILLCLVAIVILWKVVFPIAENTQQESEIRQELSKTQMGVSDVLGDLSSPENGQLEITLSRGVGEMKFVNQTMKTHTVTRTVQKTRQVPVTKTITKNGSIDIVFAIDSTGSMATDILAVKKIIQNFTLNLSQSNITYRLGLVEFKDYPVSPCGGPTDFGSKIYHYTQGNFTNNLTEFNDTLNQLIAIGGADEPESDLTAVDNASDLGFNATKNIIILLTDSKPHAKDCYTSSSFTTNTWVSCYLGPEYILSGPVNMVDKLISKNISLYYLNYHTCFNDTDIKLANLTGGEYFTYNAATAAVDIPKILMNISSNINVTTYDTETYFEDELYNDTVTEVVYEPDQIWQSLRFIIYNDTSYFSYDLPKNMTILSPDELKTYTIQTSGITNINKIEIYLVVNKDDGKEISELVATWTPDSSF